MYSFYHLLFGEMHVFESELKAFWKKNHLTLLLGGLPNSLPFKVMHQKQVVSCAYF